MVSRCLISVSAFDALWLQCFCFDLQLDALLFCAYTKVVPLQMQASMELLCQYYTAADVSHEYCIHYATVFTDKEFWQPALRSHMISAFCLGPWWHIETEEPSGVPEVLPGQWVSVGPPLSGMCPENITRPFWRHPDQLPEPPRLDVESPCQKSWPSHGVSEGQPWQPHWFRLFLSVISFFLSLPTACDQRSGLQQRSAGKWRLPFASAPTNAQWRRDVEVPPPFLSQPRTMVSVSRLI